MDFERYLTRQNIIITSLVCLFLVLVLPTVIRFAMGNDSLISEESYYHLRAASVLKKMGSFNPFDPPQDVPDMAFAPRSYRFNPYHYLLIYSSFIVSLETASRIVPLLLGISSIFLFYLLQKPFVKDSRSRGISIILLLLSPAFIYTFTASNINSAAIFLSLLAVYLFFMKSKASFIGSVVCLAFLSLFSLFNVILVMFILLAIVLGKKEGHNRLVIVILAIAALTLARRAELFVNYAYSADIDFLGNVLSDLGAVEGFGIFTLMLAIYGVVFEWHNKGKFLLFFGISVALLLMVFFIGGIANTYLMFFVAIAASIGLTRLLESRWTIDSLKSLTLLVVICGILFSSVSFINRLSTSPPDKTLVESLEWMRDNAFKDSYVLTDSELGFLVQTISRNPVLSDSFFSSGYNQQFFYKAQDTIFYSKKADDVKQLFNAYKLKYILLTPEMKQGGVWSRENEGLLFVIRHSASFRKAYENNGIEIWEFNQV